MNLDDVIKAYSLTQRMKKLRFMLQCLEGRSTEFTIRLDQQDVELSEGVVRMTLERQIQVLAGVLQGMGVDPQ